MQTTENFLLHRTACSVKLYLCPSHVMQWCHHRFVNRRALMQSAHWYITLNPWMCKICCMTRLSQEKRLSQALTVLQGVRRLIMLWSNSVTWLHMYSLVFLSLERGFFCLTCIPSTEHITLTTNLEAKKKNKQTWCQHFNIFGNRIVLNSVTLRV